MKQIRHSRQRDAILNYLRASHIHPTAEEVYEQVRKEMPNISLGTVYRNLSMLRELGQIRTIANGATAERFDGDLSEHQHLVCDSCGQVFDIHLDESAVHGLEDISYDGQITGYDIVFHGRCRNCAV